MRPDCLGMIQLATMYIDWVNYGMKEMNKRITVTDMTEGKDISIKLNKCLSSNIKRVFTCEVIQHSNGKHYIRVLATDKESWRKQSFDNLQVQ